MRRAQHERYRVYSADEFLAALSADSQGRATRPCGVGVASVSSPACARRRTRLAGATLLLGAVGSVGGVTAASMLAGQRHVRTGRQTAAVRRQSAVLAPSRLERRAAASKATTRSPASISGDRHARRPSRAARTRSRQIAAAGRPARLVPIAGHAELAAVRVSAGEQPQTPVVPSGGGEEFGFER